MNVLMCRQSSVHFTFVVGVAAAMFRRVPFKWFCVCVYSPLHDWRHRIWAAQQNTDTKSSCVLFSTFWKKLTWITRSSFITYFSHCLGIFNDHVKKFFWCVCAPLFVVFEAVLRCCTEWRGWGLIECRYGLKWALYSVEAMIRSYNSYVAGWYGRIDKLYT